MTTDRATELLVEALKQAMTLGGEQRLYKSGKLPGLFAAKTGVNGAAAELALKEGLLEPTHTDTRGKTPVEWVKITAKGTDFVLARESPVRAMDELRSVLEVNQDGVPGWVAEFRQALTALSERLTNEVETIGRKMAALTQRVTEAIKRVQAGLAQVPEGVAGPIPWSQDVLEHLEKRRQGGVSAPCPLPELFTAVREREAELSIAHFHSGLRRLHDRGMIRLLPFTGPGDLPEPEFALLDGSTVIYYASPLSSEELALTRF